MNHFIRRHCASSCADKMCRSFARQYLKSITKAKKIGERRIDLIVAGRLLVELKAVETILPLHKAQVRTYLKITRLRLGLLINFNVEILKDGIRRIINPSVQ